MSKAVQYNFSVVAGSNEDGVCDCYQQDTAGLKTAIIVPYVKTYQDREFPIFLTSIGPGGNPERSGKYIVEKMKVGDLIDVTEKTLTDQMVSGRPDVWVWRVIDNFEDRFKQLDIEKQLASRLLKLTEQYDRIVFDFSNKYLVNCDQIDVDEFEGDTVLFGADPSALDGVFANTYVRLAREMVDATYKYDASWRECVSRRTSDYSDWISKLVKPDNCQNVDVTFIIDDEHYKRVYGNDKTITVTNLPLSYNGNFACDLDVISALGLGKKIARQLADLPANVCTPVNLHSFAESIIQTVGGGVTPKHVSFKSMAYNDFAKCGGLLAVSSGSDARPAVTIMEYTPPGSSPDIPTMVLIGKGVTFDAGGISIKPSAKMNEMKYDMCGAAAVIGVMTALNACPSMCKNMRVVGIVPATENLLNGHAVKPGDVITMYDGQTVEVNNTDAEGRLILADMIAYAKDIWKPISIVDIATLTGAISGTLDGTYAGLFSNEAPTPEMCFGRNMSCELLSMCGEFTANNELLWHMPIHRNYDKKLESKFADMANIGPAGAGGSVAACFLKRFVGDNIAWAHLDIAGTAWNSKGATGWGVYSLAAAIAAIDSGV